MVNLEKQQPKNLTVQVFMGAKGEMLGRCTLLIVQEGAIVPVPADVLAAKAYPDDVSVVKLSENMASKAAIIIAQKILSTPTVQSPVFIACPDKSVLDALCSVEYPAPDTGKTVRLVAAGTKPAAPVKKAPARKPAAPKPAKAAKPEPAKSEQAKDEVAEMLGEDLPAKTPDVSDISEPEFMEEALVKPNGEANLDPVPETKDPEPPKSDNAASRIIHIMRTKVPAGCIAPCLDAIREADDPEITLPLQVKLKLARSGFDANPDEITAKLAPVFAEIKTLMAEAAQ